MGYVTHNVTSAAVASGPAVYFQGGVLVGIPFNFETVATNGTVHIIGQVSPFDIYVGCEWGNDAVTAGSDYQLGLYDTTQKGAVLDADCFITQSNLQSAQVSNYADSGIATLANYGKMMYEILGLTRAQAVNSGAYDVAWTGNVAGSGTGTLAGLFKVIKGTRG